MTFLCSWKKINSENKMENTDLLWVQIEPFFQNQMKRIQENIKGEKKESKDFLPEDFHGLYEMVYEATKNWSWSDSSQIVFKEYQWLSDFLEKQTLENPDQLQKIHQGFHLLADWLYLLFYHQNKKHFQFFSTQCVFASNLFGMFLEKNQEWILAQLLDLWKILCEDPSSISYISSFKTIWKICQDSSIPLILNLRMELIIESLVFIKKSQREGKDFILDTIKSFHHCRKIFDTLWEDNYHEQFIEMFREICMESLELDTKALWITVLEEQSDKWEDLFEFLAIYENNEVWWNYHSTHFRQKWKSCSFEQMVEEIYFQWKCMEKLEENYPHAHWRHILTLDTEAIWCYRKDLYEHCNLALHKNILERKETEPFLKVAYYCKEKEVFCSIYQTYLRQRLIGTLGFEPNLLRELYNLKLLEIYFGKSMLLNLFLMVKQREKAQNENANVFFFSKFAWGIEKNPYEHIPIPEFLQIEKKDYSFKVESFLQYGSATLTAYLGKEQRDVLMFPIQAFIITRIQKKQPFIEGIDEIYLGLEKDGLICKNASNQYVLSEGLPTIQQCSLWDPPKAKTPSVEEKVFVLEDFHIDAFIIRHLKTHKKVHHDSLLKLCGMRFPQVETSCRFKKRIEDLINKDYIERFSEDSSVYVYLS